MIVFLHFSLHSLLGSPEGKYTECREATAVLDWFCRAVRFIYTHDGFLMWKHCVSCALFRPLYLPSDCPFP